MLDIRRYRSLDGDAALSAYLSGLPNTAPGRMAVRLSLSRLSTSFRRNHHLRMALAVFEPLLENREGGLFPLASGDLVIAAAGLSDSQWSRALLRLEGWLQEAELDGREGDLVTWYDLDSADRSALKDGTPPDGFVQDTAPTEPEPDTPVRPSLPLDATVLGRLLDRLPELDPLTVLRRQPVCAVTRGHEPKTAFVWVRVDPTAAAEALEPGTDLSSNRWLARSFTDQLEDRLLEALTGKPPTRPAALSLGLKAVLSERFAAFDAALGDLPRPVLILPKLDVFADTAGWLTACDLARAAGYRLSIGGLTREALPLVDRAALGADLLWLAADSGLGATDATETDRLATAITKAGTARVILTGVDRPSLRKAGHALGISLMVGDAIRPQDAL